MKKIIVALILLIVTENVMSLGQTRICGSALTSEGKPAEAYVTVSDKAGKVMLGFADVQSDGQYVLEFTSQTDSVLMVVAGISIARIEKMISNQSQEVHFIVVEQEMQLKEVAVKAQKIVRKGDTISYNVASYKQQDDRVIGDVLRKMPGIEVSDNGGIKFNGKLITKFYVEDMDLLQGRYGLATNNINADDVASVQVLQNHQPIKMLRGRVETDDVAINLKLRDSAKGTIAVNGMLGGGWQEDNSLGHNPLWASEVVGMYFAKRKQNMSVYKGNDVGDDVAKELTAHYQSVRKVSLSPICPSAAILPPEAGLNRQRIFDNHSNIVSVNHLAKISKEAEVTLNATYLHDNISRSGESESDCFISEESRLYTREKLSSQSKVNDLNVGLTYNYNADNGFTYGQLAASSQWNSDKVNSSLSAHQSVIAKSLKELTQVAQYFDRPQYSLSSVLNTIRSFNEHTIEILSSVGYSKRPNTLSVEIDSLEQWTTTENSVQEIDSHQLAGYISSGYHYRNGSFSYGCNLNYDISIYDVETVLAHPNLLVDSTNNDFCYARHLFSFGTNCVYDNHNWKVSLNMPLELQVKRLSNHVQDNSHSYSRMLFCPSFTVRYAKLEWSTSISGFYSKSLSDPAGLYTGWVMSNYRSFQRSYTDELKESNHYGATARMDYKNPINGWFANGSFSYKHTTDNQLSGYSYKGTTSLVETFHRPHSSHRYAVDFTLSKGFDLFNMKVSTFGNYSHTTSLRLIEQKSYPFHTQSINYGGGLSATPWPRLNVVLSVGYGQNRSLTDQASVEKARYIMHGSQRIKLNLYVTKRTTLTAIAENSYNNLTEVDRNVWLGDIVVKQHCRKVDLQLELNNLFDRHQYTQVISSGLDTHTQVSNLRPRHFLLTIRTKIM